MASGRRFRKLLLLRNRQGSSLNTTGWENSSGTIHWTLTPNFHACSDGECMLSCHQESISSGRMPHQTFWNQKFPLGLLLHSELSASPGQAINIHLAQQDLSVLLSLQVPLFSMGEPPLVLC